MWHLAHCQTNLGRVQSPHFVQQPNLAMGKVSSGEAQNSQVSMVQLQKLQDWLKIPSSALLNCIFKLSRSDLQVGIRVLPVCSRSKRPVLFSDQLVKSLSGSSSKVYPDNRGPFKVVLTVTCRALHGTHVQSHDLSSSLSLHHELSRLVLQQQECSTLKGRTQAWCIWLVPTARCYTVSSFYLYCCIYFLE